MTAISSLLNTSLESRDCAYHLFFYRCAEFPCIMRPIRNATDVDTIMQFISSVIIPDLSVFTLVLFFIIVFFTSHYCWCFNCYWSFPSLFTWESSPYYLNAMYSIHYKSYWDCTCSCYDYSWACSYSYSITYILSYQFIQ